VTLTVDDTYLLAEQTAVALLESNLDSRDVRVSYELCQLL